MCQGCCCQRIFQTVHPLKDNYNALRSDTRNRHNLLPVVKVSTVLIVSRFTESKSGSRLFHASGSPRPIVLMTKIKINLTNLKYKIWKNQDLHSFVSWWFKPGSRCLNCASFLLKDQLRQKLYRKCRSFKILLKRKSLKNHNKYYCKNEDQ